MPLDLKQTFPPIIWIFTEGDGIESRLPFKIFPTLSPSPFRVLFLLNKTFFKVHIFWEGHQTLNTQISPILSTWRCVNSQNLAISLKTIHQANFVPLPWILNNQYYHTILLSLHKDYSICCSNVLSIKIRAIHKRSLWLYYEFFGKSSFYTANCSCQGLWNKVLGAHKIILSKNIHKDSLCVVRIFMYQMLALIWLKSFEFLYVFHFLTNVFKIVT